MYGNRCENAGNTAPGKQFVRNSDYIRRDVAACRRGEPLRLAGVAIVTTWRGPGNRERESGLVCSQDVHLDTWC